VAVQGAVVFDARVRYRSRLRLWDYIDQAGGPTGAADLSRVSIEYPNGERAIARRRALWFDVNPTVEPGSTIFVPERPEGDVRTDWGDIINRTVGITTSVLTTLILIQRL
jgi:protein involved in polysaccharide export with SLBB domain